MLALDDFGTGYSNLRCLSDLKPAYIKIDRSFTLKALNREYEYRLLNHIVEMSHSLGLHVCVEGIETEGELTKAKQTERIIYRGFCSENLAAGRNSHRSSSQNRPDKGLFMRV